GSPARRARGGWHKPATCATRSRRRRGLDDGREGAADEREERAGADQADGLEDAHALTCLQWTRHVSHGFAHAEFQGLGFLREIGAQEDVPEITPTRTVDLTAVSDFLSPSRKAPAAARRPPRPGPSAAPCPGRCPCKPRGSRPPARRPYG